MDNVFPLPIKVQYDDASKAFIAWLENARQGDKYLYFTGVHLGGVQVARLAMRAYEKGSVTLYQNRGLEKHNFEYWAVQIR